MCVIQKFRFSAKYIFDIICICCVLGWKCHVYSILLIQLTLNMKSNCSALQMEEKCQTYLSNLCGRQGKAIVGEVQILDPVLMKMTNIYLNITRLKVIGQPQSHISLGFLFCQMKECLQRWPDASYFRLVYNCFDLWL